MTHTGKGSKHVLCVCRTVFAASGKFFFDPWEDQTSAFKHSTFKTSDDLRLSHLFSAGLKLPDSGVWSLFSSCSQVEPSSMIPVISCSTGHMSRGPWTRHWNPTVVPPSTAAVKTTPYPGGSIKYVIVTFFKSVLYLSHSVPHARTIFRQWKWNMLFVETFCAVLWTKQSFWKVFWCSLITWTRVFYIHPFVLLLYTRLTSQGTRVCCSISQLQH